MTTEEGIKYFCDTTYRGYDQVRLLQSWAEYNAYKDMLDVLYRNRGSINHIDWSEACNHFSALKYSRMRSIVGMLMSHFENEYRFSDKCDKLFGKGNWEG